VLPTFAGMEHTSHRSVTATLDGAPYTTRITTRGLTVVTDEPLDKGGRNEGPGPHELLLGGLAGCTAITLRMYCDRKQWDVGAISVEASLEREQRGRDIESRIHMDVSFGNPLSAEQRERLGQIARSCPVHRTLESPIHLSSAITG